LILITGVLRRSNALASCSQFRIVFTRDEVNNLIKSADYICLISNGW